MCIGGEMRIGSKCDCPRNECATGGGNDPCSKMGIPIESWCRWCLLVEAKKAPVGGSLTEGELYLTYMALRSAGKAGWDFDEDDVYPEASLYSLQESFQRKFRETPMKIWADKGESGVVK